MSLPPPVPAEKKRGIPKLPFSPDEGDRAEVRYPFALARALSRVPARGRQQVTRRLGPANGRPYWLIQDVR